MINNTSISVSIIIPSYNRIGLLKETLKSVEAAIKNVTAEIILVDDGSAMPISDQIPEFKHLPLSFIRQENSGLTTARYNGLLAAKGEYIQFLDSDRQVAVNKFDIQLNAMKHKNADVSHTNIAEYLMDSQTQKLTLQTVRKTRHSDEPGEFFIRVQPPPHSPIFRREYLLAHILNAFIPLSRDYDSIGECWFYYNLSIHPATIIKVNEPLTLIIHHDNFRITDNWEIMGLCALTLQNRFVKYFPLPQYAGSTARKRVAIAAFNTFKRLPYNVNKSFQNAFVDVWRKLGKAPVKDLNGGFYFSILSYIIGTVNAAKVFKRLKISNYDKVRTITDQQLESRLKPILNEFGERS